MSSGFSNGGLVCKMIEVGDYNASLGDYRVRNVLAAGIYSFNFSVPMNFKSLESLSLICHPSGDVAGGDIDLDSQYGAPGESISAHQEVDHAITFDLSTGKWNAMDISTVFSALQAGDICCVKVTQALGGGVSVDYKAICFTYYTV